MNWDELLTRLTIWIALIGYGLGATHLLSDRKIKWEAKARLAWTIALVFLIAHVTLAFHYFHHWSQTSAYAETARQTDEVFGVNWGGGLFVNYALIVIWLIDVVWWWIRPESHQQQPRWLLGAWQGFLIFIIFNATVVFVSGPLRWIGLALCLWLILVWLRSWRSRNSFKLDTLTDRLSKE